MNNSNDVCTNIRATMMSVIESQVPHKIAYTVRRVAASSMCFTAQCSMRTQTGGPVLDWVRYSVACPAGTATATRTCAAVWAAALGRVAHQPLSQIADPAEGSAGGAIDASVGVTVKRSAGDHTASSIKRSAGVGTCGMTSCVAHLGVRTEVAVSTENRVLRRVHHQAVATTCVHTYASVAQRIVCTTVRAA